MLNILGKDCGKLQPLGNKHKGARIDFYLRFAELLVNGTDVKISHGETVSKRNQIATEINKALFHNFDTLPTYPRNIDLS